MSDKVKHGLMIGFGVVLLFVAIQQNNYVSGLKAERDLALKNCPAK